MDTRSLAYHLLVRRSTDCGGRPPSFPPPARDRVPTSESDRLYNTGAADHRGFDGGFARLPIKYPLKDRNIVVLHNPGPVVPVLTSAQFPHKRRTFAALFCRHSRKSRPGHRSEGPLHFAFVPLPPDIRRFQVLRQTSTACRKNPGNSRVACAVWMRMRLRTGDRMQGAAILRDRLSEGDPNLTQFGRVGR